MYGYGETIGNPCKQCRGNGKTQSKESVSVKIPKGVDDGTKSGFREKEKQEAKVVVQEIYIYLYRLTITVFLKDQTNIYILVPISFTDAALGVSVEFLLLMG